MERRQNSRFKLAIPAYLDLPDSSVVVAARTTNIGKGGFICLTNAPLELGTVVRARLQLTPHEAFDCRAQVCRMSDVPDARPGTSVSVVAFRFVDLGEGKESHLERALSELGADLDTEDVPKAYRSR